MEKNGKKKKRKAKLAPDHESLAKQFKWQFLRRNYSYSSSYDCLDEPQIYIYPDGERRYETQSEHRRLCFPYEWGISVPLDHRIKICPADVTINQEAICSMSTLCFRDFTEPLRTTEFTDKLGHDLGMMGRAYSGPVDFDDPRVEYDKKFANFTIDVTRFSGKYDGPALLRRIAQFQQAYKEDFSDLHAPVNERHHPLMNVNKKASFLQHVLDVIDRCEASSISRKGLPADYQAVADSFGEPISRQPYDPAEIRKTCETARKYIWAMPHVRFFILDEKEEDLDEEAGEDA
jgi:hypothetical protein